MRYYSGPLIVLILFLFLNISCQKLDVSATFGKDENPSNFIESSVLWIQRSAEARALYYQTFALAKMQLVNSLSTFHGSKPPAVIVDVDETVLDNSPYEAMLIIDDKEYPKYWDDWIDLAVAKPVPGALEFLLFADSMGVDVFYITNRNESQKKGTLLNLIRVGFPDAVSEHLLVKTESSDKTSRRQVVSQSHEILLLCGDNLGDFDQIFQEKSVTERSATVDSLKRMFGTRFIILPNPMYGDWIGAAYNYDYRIENSKKIQMRQKLLDVYSRPIK